MKRILIIGVLVLNASAQTPPAIALTLAGSAAVVPYSSAASTVALTINLAGSAGNNISALSWQTVLPPGVTISSSSATMVAPSALTAGKGLYCGFVSAASAAGATLAPLGGGCAPITGSLNSCGPGICTILGLTPAPANIVSNAPFAADGPIATLQLSIAAGLSGPLVFALSNTMGSDINGNALGVNLPSLSSTYAMTIASPCDVNGDGKVDFNDVVAVVNAITGVGVCPLSIPDGGCSLTNLVDVIEAVQGGACLVK